MQGKAVACEERAKTFKICHLEVIKKQISKPRRLGKNRMQSTAVTKSVLRRKNELC